MKSIYKETVITELSGMLDRTIDGDLVVYVDVAKDEPPMTYNVNDVLEEHEGETLSLKLVKEQAV